MGVGALEGDSLGLHSRMFIHVWVWLRLEMDGHPEKLCCDWTIQGIALQVRPEPTEVVHWARNCHPNVLKFSVATEVT